MSNHLRRAFGASLLCCVLLSARTGFGAPLIQSGEQLTLSRAIEIALANHPRRREAEARALAAGEQVGEARSAMLPQVYGAAEYLRTTDNAIGDTSYLNPGFVPRIPGRDHDAPPDVGQSFSTGDNYLSGVAANQYLLDFGRVRGFIAERKDEAAAAQAALKLVELNLVFEVTQRYFALLAANEIVKVYEQAVTQRREQLHAAQVRAQAGLTAQIDVFTAQSALARARVHLLDSRNEVDKAKVALDNAMGLGPEAPQYRISQVLTYQKITGSPGDYFQIALKDRPDLSMFEEEARAEGAKIVQYRSDYFPTVAATAGYNAMGTGLPAANNFDVGIVITWPIFSGFLTEHQVAEMRLRQKAVRDAIEDLRQRIYLEVKSAFLDWQTSLQRIREAELTLQASKVELELANKRYTTGLGNIIELTDAERFFVQDNAAYVGALYQFSVAKAALQRATGGLLAEQ